MSRKVKLAANILKTLVITLAPIYIPILLFLHFGFGIEIVLAAILSAQTYIFIIQAEAMLKQAELSRARYNTSFDLKRTLPPFIGVNAGEKAMSYTETSTFIEIHNTGNKPAYNFFVGARDESRDKPIPPKMWGDWGFTLNPSQKSTFSLPISTEEFKSHEISLIISYDNILGDSCDVRAISFEGNDNFIMMPLREELGFLVKAYRDLRLYIRWYSRYRKLKRFKGCKGAPSTAF